MTIYKLLGADGRQYGPVTGEQVIRWVQEGRANAYTKVCIEGTVEWRVLSDFPEFAAALRERAAEAPKPSRAAEPGSSEGRADALANEIITRDFDVEIARCFSRGWDLVASRFWFCVGVTALMTLLSWALGVLPVLGGLLLNYVLWTGLDWVFLKMIRGETVEVSDAFVGFSKPFLPLMLFSLVAQLLTMLGFAVCILPGIYLAVTWLMFPGLLIIDKQLDFWPAMELSRKVVTRHWWQFFGLMLLSLLACLAGVLLCAVGLFVALPVVTAAVVYAYEDVFGKTAAASQPALAAPQL